MTFLSSCSRTVVLIVSGRNSAITIMVTCEKIAGVGSKCSGLKCTTTPCTGLDCPSLTKVNQTCQGVTNTGVNCLNGTGVIVPDALDILIKTLNSNGMSLENHMVENSLFICPDKVKEQMDDLMNLLRNLGKPNNYIKNNYIKKGNYKLPVRYSASLKKTKNIFVEYYDVYGKPLVVHDCRQGYAMTSKNDVFTKITDKSSSVTVVYDYKGITIVIDPNNNNFVHTAISKYTGVKIGRGESNTIRNYIVSHILAKTYDPFYFSSLWNVVIIPNHCNFLMDKPGLSSVHKSSATRMAAHSVQNLFRAICYQLYKPNNYLADIENILKQNYPNVQIPRVAAPSPADLEKAQACIDNGLIFI